MYFHDQSFSLSLGTSPQLRRASTKTGSITNLFNTLRRTRSHFFTTSSSHSTAAADTSPASTSTRHISTSDLHDQEASPPVLESHRGANSSSMSNLAAQNSSAPGLLMMVKEKRSQEPQLQQRRSSPKRDDVEGDEENGRTSDVLIRVRTATMTSADSSKTLTDVTVESAPSLSSAAAAAAAGNSNEHRFSPNPAGAASASSGSHVRHTTNSSVESEGFHSVTSEDMSLEDLVHQDWSQWSKQVSSTTHIGSIQETFMLFISHQLSRAGEIGGGLNHLAPLLEFTQFNQKDRTLYQPFLLSSWSLDN